MRQLRHLVALSEERHFTRAATRVHLTQSSLSSSIRALERELGADLFVRSTRRVELTEAGRALVPAALRAIAAADAGRDAVAGVQGLLRGRLALGAIQTVGLVDVPELLARFHRRHTEVTLRLEHGSVTSLVQRTADGELELAVVDKPLGPQGGRVRERPLGTESLLLAVAADGALAGRRRIRLGDLAAEDFVEYRPDSSLRATIDVACQAAGLDRRIACEADTIADVVELVAHGVGVSLLPPLAVRASGGRVAGLHTEPEIGRELTLVAPRDGELSPAGRAFVELVGDRV